MLPEMFGEHNRGPTEKQVFLSLRYVHLSLSSQSLSFQFPSNMIPLSVSLSSVYVTVSFSSTRAVSLICHDTRQRDRDNGLRLAL